MEMNEEKMTKTRREMLKTVLSDSESVIGKMLSNVNTVTNLG